MDVAPEGAPRADPGAHRLRRAPPTSRTPSTRWSRRSRETLLIVVVVIFLFLGSLRSVLVPVVAIPVSLIGAVFLMQVVRLHAEPADAARDRALGRARGRRRDRGRRERRAPPARGDDARSTRRSRGARELVGPIIAMTITLAAVYTPIAFQGGLTGSLFREFALTLAGAVTISGVVALTLSPVMSAALLRRGQRGAGARRAASTAASTGSRRPTRGTSTRSLQARAAPIYAAWVVVSAPRRSLMFIAVAAASSPRPRTRASSSAS